MTADGREACGVPHPLRLPRVRVLTLWLFLPQWNGSRKYGYILLHDPHGLALELKAKKKISDAWLGGKAGE